MNPPFLLICDRNQRSSARIGTNVSQTLTPMFRSHFGKISVTFPYIAGAEFQIPSTRPSSVKLPAWDSFLVFEPGKRVCPTRVTGCGLGVAHRGLCDDPWGSRRFRYSPRPHRRPDGTRAGACRRWCRQNSPSGSPPVHFESPSPAQGS